MNIILAAIFVSSSGSGLIGIMINLLILLLILGLIYWIITLLPLPPIFKTVAQIILAIVVIIYLASFLTGCGSLKKADTYVAIAKTNTGATIVAQASNKVVAAGLNAGATKIDTGNPYLHSLAEGFRANSLDLVSKEQVIKIANDYGDPAKPQRFKTLALNLWEIIKASSDKIVRSAAANLVADGLNAGAVQK